MYIDTGFGIDSGPKPRELEPQINEATEPNDLTDNEGQGFNIINNEEIPPAPKPIVEDGSNEFAAWPPKVEPGNSIPTNPGSYETRLLESLRNQGERSEESEDRKSTMDLHAEINIAKDITKAQARIQESRHELYSLGGKKGSLIQKLIKLEQILESQRLTPDGRLLTSSELKQKEVEYISVEISKKQVQSELEQVRAQLRTDKDELATPPETVVPEEPHTSFVDIAGEENYIGEYNNKRIALAEELTKTDEQREELVTLKNYQNETSEITLTRHDSEKKSLLLKLVGNIFTKTTKFQQAALAMIALMGITQQTIDSATAYSKTQENKPKPSATLKVPMPEAEVELPKLNSTYTPDKSTSDELSPFLSAVHQEQPAVGIPEEPEEPIVKESENGYRPQSSVEIPINRSSHKEFVKLPEFNIGQVMELAGPAGIKRDVAQSVFYNGEARDQLKTLAAQYRSDKQTQNSYRFANNIANPDAAALREVAQRYYGAQTPAAGEGNDATPKMATAKISQGIPNESRYVGIPEEQAPTGIPEETPEQGGGQNAR